MSLGHSFHVNSTSSGLPHPREAAEQLQGPPATPLAPGQSNVAGRAIGKSTDTEINPYL